MFVDCIFYVHYQENITSNLNLIENITDDFSKLNTENNDLIILGDMNVNLFIMGNIYLIKAIRKLQDAPYLKNIKSSILLSD